MATFKELPEDKKAALEAAIKERAVRDGFDPDGHWARYVKVRTADDKIKLSEMQRDILDEMHRRGWEKPADLDSEAYIVGKEDDRVVDAYDGWHSFDVVFGGSEGIYIDWTYHEYDSKKDAYVRHRCDCFKTLGESLQSAEQMGLLAGRLTWLAREIYP